MGDASISNTHSGLIQDERNKAQWNEAEVGPTCHHRLHASTARHVQWIGHEDRPDDGAQGRVARRNRIWNPDDSVLHQSWWKKSEYSTAHGARKSQTHPSAASCQAESHSKEALSQRASRSDRSRLPEESCSRGPRHLRRGQIAGLASDGRSAVRHDRPHMWPMITRLGEMTDRKRGRSRIPADPANRDTHARGGEWCGIS